MAFSKAPTFDPLLYAQSIWSKALAHPARIIILKHLLIYGETSFQDLRKIIPLAPTTVSQHLKILRSYNLIKAREKFPHTYYSLHKKNCRGLAARILKLNFSFSV